MYCVADLDHTADVQLHACTCRRECTLGEFRLLIPICGAGGGSLEEVFEQVVVCMFDYITDLDAVVNNDACNRELAVSGSQACV